MPQAIEATDIAGQVKGRHGLKVVTIPAIVKPVSLDPMKTKLKCNNYGE